MMSCAPAFESLAHTLSVEKVFGPLLEANSTGFILQAAVGRRSL